MLALILAGQANSFTICNDDIPAEIHYTFTGEATSDFLIGHEDFSLFKRIAERAGETDFLGSRNFSANAARVKCGIGG